MADTSPLVRRFYDVLVQEISARRPEYLESPFSVAEIYQNLVPYSSHRDRIGVAMNGDYEDALLRLLAGEGGYLVLDSEAALRELREELETPNPNTGIYREFAAVDVSLNPSAERPTERARSPREDGARRAEAPKPDPGHPAPVASRRAPSQAGTRPSARGGSCRRCDAELPDRPNLRFCAFCGGDVNVVPCPACGEDLELGWRFCVACGAPVES